MSKSRKTWRRKLLLLATATFLSGFIAEFIVRIAKPGFPGFQIPQIVHRPAPGLGFEMIPNQRGYTFAKPATINSQGLRSPELLDRLVVDVRMVCLGDSITYGVGVGDEIPYPRQLERLLNAASSAKTIEVVNTGVQRYATYQEMDYLRGAVQELQPDVVILAIYPNDLAIRPEGDYTEDYENQREQAATSFRKKAPWLYLLAKNSALIELSKQVYLSRGKSNRSLRRLTGTLTEKDEKRWAAMAAELKMFRKLSEDYAFRPLVVTIPARIQVQRVISNSHFPARILAICADLELPVVDVHDRFVASLKKGLDPYLDWDNHLSETGHRIVAEALGERLSQ